MSSHWGRKEIDALAEMIGKGWPHSRIAEATGRTRKAIGNAAQRFGLAQDKGGDRRSPMLVGKWSDEDTADLLRMRDEGMSWSQCAIVMHRTPTACKKRAFHVEAMAHREANPVSCGPRPRCWEKPQGMGQDRIAWALSNPGNREAALILLFAAEGVSIVSPDGVVSRPKGRKWPVAPQSGPYTAVEAAE